VVYSQEIVSFWRIPRVTLPLGPGSRQSAVVYPHPAESPRRSRGRLCRSRTGWARAVGVTRPTSHATRYGRVDGRYADGDLLSRCGGRRRKSRMLRNENAKLFQAVSFAIALTMTSHRRTRRVP
jgi:hypothetical protein